jgi:hypothetical protein
MALGIGITSIGLPLNEATDLDTAKEGTQKRHRTPPSLKHIFFVSAFESAIMLR